MTLRQWERYNPKHEPSAQVASIIPRDKFTKAQAYCRAKSSFQIIMSIIEIVLEVFLTLKFVLPSLWFYSERFAAGSELRQTLVFTTIFGLVNTVIELPSSIYSTFVLEAKFGFNRTTPKTFVLDMVKGLVLSAVLGFPILSLLYYLLRYLSGYSAVVVATGLWVMASSISIIMLLIYPTVIAPLFNKFDPMKEGPLKGKLTALAGQLGFPLDKIYVIDGSRRSSHSNAYIFGLFKKYICIYDSLLEQTKGNDEQVVSVLCHELGHWQYSHLAYGLVISLVQVFLLSLLYGATAGNADLFKSFGYGNEMPLIIGLMLFNYVYSPIDDLMSPFQNMLSRRFEYQADEFAKQKGMAKELGDALVSMSISNLSNMSPDPLYSAVNYSHPTLLERLSALDVSPKAKKEE